MSLKRRSGNGLLIAASSRMLGLRCFALWTISLVLLLCLTCVLHKCISSRCHTVRCCQSSVLSMRSHLIINVLFLSRVLSQSTSLMSRLK